MIENLRHACAILRAGLGLVVGWLVGVLNGLNAPSKAFNVRCQICTESQTAKSSLWMGLGYSI